MFSYSFSFSCFYASIFDQLGIYLDVMSEIGIMHLV